MTKTMPPPQQQLHQPTPPESEEEPTLPKKNPSSWAQSLHPDFINQTLISFDFDALLDETACKNVNELTTTIANTKGLAIFSIASGTKGSTILLHNVDVVGNLTIALSGAGKMSSIHILDIKKAFKKKNGVPVPLALHMLLNGGGGIDITEVPTRKEDTEEISIPSSFISPPWLTKIIFNEELTAAKDILLAAIEYLRHFNVHENAGSNSTEDDDEVLSSLEEDDIEGKRIMQALYS